MTLQIEGIEAQFTKFHVGVLEAFWQAEKLCVLYYWLDAL